MVMLQSVKSSRTFMVCSYLEELPVFISRGSARFPLIDDAIRISSFYLRLNHPGVKSTQSQLFASIRWGPAFNGASMNIRVDTRIDWFDLATLQGTPKSSPTPIKASNSSAFSLLP